MPQGMVTQKPVTSFKNLSNASLARQIKRFGRCHFPFILINILFCFALSRSIMVWFSDMLGVYVPCTYVHVLNGNCDIMRDNGHISYILWMSDYTL